MVFILTDGTKYMRLSLDERSCFDGVRGQGFRVGQA